jgi:hypothetical protein
MRTHAPLIAAAMLLATAGNGVAAVHYVDLNSSKPAPPYLWVVPSPGAADVTSRLS